MRALIFERVASRMVIWGSLLGISGIRKGPDSARGVLVQLCVVIIVSPIAPRRENWG